MTGENMLEKEINPGGKEQLQISVLSSNVKLGEYVEKTEQLNEISRYMWKHSGILASEGMDIW